MQPRTWLPLVIVLAALLSPGVAQAVPRQEMAQSGAVRAVFSHDCEGPVDCRNLQLEINRRGVTLLREAIPSRRALGPSPGSSLRVRDLDGNGEPEVLLDLYTGGAHCCFVLRLYHYRGGAYRGVVRDFGDVGYRLRDLGGDRRPELLSADPRFSLLYTSYVESRFPIRVLTWRGDRLRDVTRRFRPHVRRDRDRHLRFYRRVRRARGDVRGALAAYQADNYILGRRAAASGWRLLERLARAGAIRRPRFATGPQGRAYVRSLRRKLRRLGYVR